MITNLKSNQIFVYGSNLHGRNGGGAARQAQEYFGAKDGVGVGRVGSCYAIPTLDGNFQKLPLNVIEHYLREFAYYAELHPRQEFLLTAIGQGIAGFSKEEMESIMPTLPNNIIRV